MKNIDSIKRIRFANVKRGRWYGFTARIMDGKADENCGIGKPVKSDANWCNLTDQGRRIVNKLLSTKGVRYISASAFGMVVEIDPVFEWGDYHDDIIELLNKTLFAGLADVGPAGARRADEGLIMWSGTRKSTVRWFGTSLPLRQEGHLKDKAACVVSSPVDDKNWCNLTPEARDVVNTIFALDGVYTIWVTPFDLSVEIAPVFSWSDYHDTVIALLKEKIFGGKAYVEYRQD